MKLILIFFLIISSRAFSFDPYGEKVPAKFPKEDYTLFARSIHSTYGEAEYGLSCYERSSDGSCLRAALFSSLISDERFYEYTVFTAKAVLDYAAKIEYTSYSGDILPILNFTLRTYGHWYAAPALVLDIATAPLQLVARGGGVLISKIKHHRMSKRIHQFLLDGTSYKKGIRISEL
jgi:hypothetical protein